MSTKFLFDDLSLKDVLSYQEHSNVFNMPEEDILKERILLTSFSDESLGSSEERLDIALYNKGDWHLLDIQDKIKEYNEIPVGYLIEGEQFTRVMVIIRRMSDILIDKKKSGVTSYILCKVPSQYKNVQNDKALFGLLAKSHVYLDLPESEIKSQIKSNIYDRNEEILSRLFA